LHSEGEKERQRVMAEQAATKAAARGADKPSEMQITVLHALVRFDNPRDFPYAYVENM